MICFAEFHQRFVAHLRDRVSSGDVTERGLARLTGVSQPHVHNVLHGKRLFSMETADQMLRKLHLDLLDFLDAAEFVEGQSRRPTSR
jgi:transcriptional regulator with XRE-family HTH domain